MTVRNRSFVTLDGLRGIAALAILTRHAPAFFASVAIMIPLSGRTGPAVSVGPFYESYLAVDFFFALSGFVLAHAYGARLGSSLSGLRFMAVRLIRLYPLYVFALLIATLLAVPRALSHDQSGLLETLKNLLPAILFLPAPPVSGDAVLFPFNGPAWSLFFELLANGCIAIVGFRLRSRTLGAIVGIAGLALAAAVVSGRCGFGSSTFGAIDFGFRWDGFGAGCLRVGFAFFAGILIYRAWQRWQPTLRVPPLLIGAALLGALAADPSEGYRTTYDLVMIFAGFPLLIWLGASSVADGAIGRLFTWLGVASYAMYVLQEPLYLLTVTILTRVFHLDLSNLGLIWGIGFIGLVFALAVAADRAFDRPMRKLLNAALGVWHLPPQFTRLWPRHIL